MADGKAWAWTGFVLGVAVSVAGNVAHTWHPTAEQLATSALPSSEWKPELGAQLMAAFFPIALLVTVEVLARTPWPSAKGWAAARFGGTGLVAAVAAIVSYLHLHGLLTAYGEGDVTRTIGPLAVDGLMVVTGFALLAISRARSRRNGAAAPAVQLPEPSVATAEAELAGTGSLGPVLRAWRRITTKASPVIVEDLNAPAEGASDEPPVAVEEITPADSATAADVDRLVWPAAEGERSAKDTDADDDDTEPLVDLYSRAVKTFANDLFAQRVPGIRSIKAELGIGQPKAQTVQMYLSDLVCS